MIPVEKCGLSNLTQQKLQSVFNKYSNIEKVILYGSRAKGNFKNGSDIDLTIQTEKMNSDVFLKIMNEIDDLNLPYQVDLSLFNQIDNRNLIEHIERIGVVFYSKT